MSCDKKYELVDAQILGPDYKKCFCCGGTIIKIGNSEFLTGGIPADAPFKLTDLTTYPIDVKLQYVKETGTCGDESRIIVQKIEKK
jgi:hypothetical protein